MKSRSSDEAVRAIVHTGGFTDAQAEAHLADVLIRRRDKVVAWTLRQVNPLAEFTIETHANGVAQQQHTVYMTGPDGGRNQVWVDVGKTDNPAVVKVDTAAGTKPK